MDQKVQLIDFFYFFLYAKPFRAKAFWRLLFLFLNCLSLNNFIFFHSKTKFSMQKSTALFSAFATFCFLFFMSTTPLFSQKNPLSIFDPLVGRTWVAEGQWGDGSLFKQEVQFEYDLNQTMVRVQADGFVDKDKTKWGKRNHGIRQWDAQSSSIQFWEFDVFGGVTSGKVFAVGDSLYYQYEYETDTGKAVLTDAWEKITAQRYRFKVGVYENEKWQEVYLETEFKALPKFSGSKQEVQVILNRIQAFSQTLLAGQAQNLSEFYTTDGKIFPRNQNIISGRTDIAQYWQPKNGNRIIAHEVTPETLDLHEDWASDYGYYQGISQNAEGKEFPFRGKYVILWKKVDGQWLIDIDIWNKVP